MCQAVAANESELREMLVNLIFNAVEAIPKAGTITIRTEARSSRLRLTVSDDGMGMSEEVKARCMEPFFTVKHEQNSGFGLGMVYGVVLRHEGDIDIKSELGTGPTSSFRCPWKGRSGARTGGGSAPGAGISRKIANPCRGRRAAGAGITRRHLNEEQHEFVTAVNGRDGLEKFRQGDFDVVLTDRAMPEMNGDALAAEIKRVKPAQPVILLTGFGDLMTSSGEKPTGVDLVVGKPFTLGTLRNAIAKVVERPPAVSP